MIVHVAMLILWSSKRALTPKRYSQAINHLAIGKNIAFELNTFAVMEIRTLRNIASLIKMSLVTYRQVIQLADHLVIILLSIAVNKRDFCRQLVRLNAIWHPFQSHRHQCSY